jgi:hypothetical protein
MDDEILKECFKMFEDKFDIFKKKRHKEREEQVEFYQDLYRF